MIYLKNYSAFQTGESWNVQMAFIWCLSSLFHICLSLYIYMYVCILFFLRVIYLSSQSQMCASSFIAYK